MRKTVLTACLLILALALGACSPAPVSGSGGFSAPAASQSADLSASDTSRLDAHALQTEAERQLAVFADCFSYWRVEDAHDWWGYAVTDLDQDGAWEIISSECHGTGHYMTTSVHEIDPVHPPVSVLTRTQSYDEEPTLEALSHGRLVEALPLLGPYLENSGETQTYPAYYDPAEHVYFYPYIDTITVKDEWHGTFTTLRAFSLNCGELPGISLGGKPSGVLLGCERVTWHGTYTTDDHWNWNGAYINHETYESLAEQCFSGWEAKEVQIKWIECEDLDGMDADQIYLLLKESQDAFSVQ